ncbi:carbohydrate ABC transporter permease [Paenibacillus sp. J5C_2022]|uniref:carbohydrate ABC transporter permease n=1 Tax=Paenibacillus sp. J5C2022 TaxID=2977129 RepID=UPI0021D1A1C5|nr:carbohydrate ABC transporter permease [Paenibacillus sp. J5C2022]MCU6713007.1 carbohydrate ABC transporter permease [Paenibacillus sp. J5C2022]
MVESMLWSRKLFVVLNYMLLSMLAFLCLFPILHVLAISFSSSTAASSGQVVLWPVDFNTAAYQYVLDNDAFMQSIEVSLRRIVVGSTIQMLLIVLTAFPLSKEARVFKWRTHYVWYFFITLLFSGGLIPTYMVVKDTGLMDSVWALVLPVAVPVFSVVLLLNFFRALPKELEESAFIDGAGYMVTLWHIVVPLSKPAIATLLLFSLVSHWNAWFDGLIYMNSPENYPLQSYLQTVVIQHDPALTDVDENLMSQLSDRTLKSAQIFIGALPILLVYPFLQKYFMKGIVMGSVKE